MQNGSENVRPLISIVTPSLNQAEFLEHTMKSVLDQSYPAVEYIVIDGGSDDGSVEAIRKYENRLAYWVSEKDTGQSNAINKGLRRVTGDIWAYICSDDTYEPEAFKRVVQAFRESTADVIFGNCNFINARGIVTRKKTPGEFDRRRLLQGNFLYQPSMFIKRWVLEDFGPFDESLHFAMDYEYWLRISRRAKFLYLDRTLSNYRLHGRSKTINATIKMNEEARDIKRLYGAGLSADLAYYRFKILGWRMYRLRRWFFEAVASLTIRK